MRILVIEDDRKLAGSLGRGLRECGYVVDLAFDGDTGLQMALAGPHDLAILDLMLPVVDGWAILERLRRERRSLGVLLLTARDAVQDRVRGLNQGADDYMVKPFAFSELLARIRAVLRRSSPAADARDAGDKRFRFGDFRFDGLKRALYRGDQEVNLSRAEYDLLQIFVQHPNRVLSRDLIMDHLSGGERDPFDRSIDVRVTRLRHKIEDDPSEPKLIRTVWGVGYQFTPKGDAP